MVHEDRLNTYKSLVDLQPPIQLVSKHMADSKWVCNFSSARNPNLVFSIKEVPRPA